ncbi:VOC family protein [Streptomyces sp. WMMC905]|uniref:VOC family protein n=1 Tax=Streptomyces sp. WMMC905 TaxID=3404123 RepID=UPI003B94A8DC
MYQQMIFVNLPVEDLAAAKGFFTELGYAIDARFGDESTAAVVVSDTIVVMLLTRSRYADFTGKRIADATSTSEVLIALSAESRSHVDALVERAVAAGGTASEKVQDLGFMYGRSFDDLDGHTWEIMWMDPAALDR